MTRQKTLKRRVRARMAKTGERYASARRQVIDRAGRRTDAALAPPESASAPAAPAFEPTTSEEALLRATGRGWDAWFAILDEWGARDRTHTETARWLVAEHGVDGWWSQSVTVSYERARGIRGKHQAIGGAGFSVWASRTVNVPAERLMSAFTDALTRARWLPEATLRRRPSTAKGTARFDWADGVSRVTVYVNDRGTRSVASVEHAKLTDAETAERMKAYWRSRLVDLKRFLEG